jgi:hypothetical protein
MQIAYASVHIRPVAYGLIQRQGSSPRLLLVFRLEIRFGSPSYVINPRPQFLTQSHTLLWLELRAVTSSALLKDTGHKGIQNEHSIVRDTITFRPAPRCDARWQMFRKCFFAPSIFPSYFE